MPPQSPLSEEMVMITFFFTSTPMRGRTQESRVKNLEIKAKRPASQLK